MDNAMIPMEQRQLVQLWWVDCTNVAGGWFDAEDLGQWSVNGAWECSNTGWLIYENDLCYVLAGRMTCDGKNAGLIERIPKNAVTRKLVIPTTRKSRESHSLQKNSVKTNAMLKADLLGS